MLERKADHNKTHLPKQKQLHNLIKIESQIHSLMAYNIHGKDEILQ